MAEPDDNWAFVLHGGAGVHAGRSYLRAEACLAHLVERGARELSSGVPAVDVVEGVVAAMEDSGLFVAGRGAAPNSFGAVELDAGIMEGASGRAGAVAALQTVANPVVAARRVMDRSPAVLLAGDGARRFAVDQGLETVPDLKAWLREPDGFEASDLVTGHGTVGAVALDRHGGLAAATSTGGTYGAPHGRVGDTPIIGAGVWADDRLAISCTGVGEAFLRTCAAHDLSARVRYGGFDLEAAASAVLEQVRVYGGDGGLIAVTSEGQLLASFNTPGMKRAGASRRGPAWVGSVGASVRPLQLHLEREGPQAPGDRSDPGQADPGTGSML